MKKSTGKPRQQRALSRPAMAMAAAATLLALAGCQNMPALDM
ncbi:MAG: peptidoglycan-binding protein, partial [Variovorax paradoxus]|nr:peptidoglycan-binding protein [Variovorax paradoxus]